MSRLASLVPLGAFLTACQSTPPDAPYRSTGLGVDAAIEIDAGTDGEVVDDSGDADASWEQDGAMSSTVGAAGADPSGGRSDAGGAGTGGEAGGAAAGMGAPEVDAGSSGPLTDSGESPNGLHPPDAARCFAGGAPIESATDAAGTCQSPIVLDLRDAEVGDVFVHVIEGLGTDEDAPPLGKCGEATARDVVYNVLLPAEADLEISVWSDDGDPIVSAQQAADVECDKVETTYCVDDGSIGQCEYLRLPVGSALFADDTPQLIVSETIDSGSELTLYLRLADPRGGA